MGKWIDNPNCAEIWKNREHDPKTYQKGMALSGACVAAQLLAGKATLKITRPCALRSI